MKLTNYISAAALMLSISACSNENDLTASFYDDADAVKINATVGEGNPFTRSNPIGTPAEQATFNNGDQIAVQAGTQAAVTYQYSGTAWAPVTTGAYLKWESDPMDFNAYYPANKNGASMEAFTLPADQSTLTNLEDADYMTCTATSVTKPAANAEAAAATVSLSLTRKTARIVISGITFNEQFKEGYTVSDIKVSGNSTGYAGGTVQTGSTIQVTSYSADSKFYALLTPTTADAGATFLTLTVKKTADNSTQELLVKGIPTTEAGMSYDYTLAVGKDLVKVGSVTVESWTDGTAIPGGEAEEVIPTYTTYNEKGEGTEADPYQIWNEAQLNDLATQNNATASIDAAYFKLLHDINLGGKEWTPIGTLEQQFKGHFDGNGHSVMGISISLDILNTGLFGYTATGSSIKNLSVNGTITNTTDIDNGRRVGILVGYNIGTITNCSAAGTVTGTANGTQALNVGGLVGYNDAGTITACSSTATVKGENANTNTAVGGLVGSNRANSSILACYATGTVTATDASAKVGGLVGNNDGGNIYACYATGAVKAADTNTNVGSLVGYTTGSIEYCLTTGDKGKANAKNENNGEITGVAKNSNGSITHCHGSIAEATLNTEGIKGDTGTGFGMLNYGIVYWNDDPNINITDPKYCHYLWKEGTNGIPVAVLAPVTP